MSHDIATAGPAPRISFPDFELTFDGKDVLTVGEL